MKKYLPLIALLPLIANANTTCKGKINQIYLNPINGYVQLDYGYGANTLCSVNQELNRVTSEACKTLYSGLLANQAQNKEVEIRYNGDFSCTMSELGNFEPPKKEAYLIYYYFK